MPNYRRSFQPGGTFFFTLVTEGRAPLFSSAHARRLLRESMEAVRRDRPFEIDSIVLLPDHLHAIWVLPEDDADYSRRWASIKARFTRAWLDGGGDEHAVSEGRDRKGGRGVWQERFWEHTIRDVGDINRHRDYIHYNPVKHGVAKCPHLYPYSSYSRWVERGGYEPDWQCGCRSFVREPIDLSWTDGLEME